MNGEEVLVLKSSQIREINVSSTKQIIKIKVSQESEIEVYLDCNRRVVVRSTKLGQSLNIKPIAANMVEIFPELRENYFQANAPEVAVKSPEKAKTQKTTLNPPKNEKADLWGVTASKMTMKKKK